ncbi:MAG: peptidoglycan-binding protein [Verrucomicrobiota bacterium]|nr:peptidoglycan-binding protein [Verrucomicrobiota bacterium]
MSPLRLLIMALALFTVALAGTARAYDEPLFHSTDPLAPRDEWAGLHQMPALDPTDVAPRYPLRFLYYFEGRKDLAGNPAYVGALQNALRRLGYYCGPTDGIFSYEVSDAIARMQKSYRMRVSGTLTIPIRRALFLP